MENIYHVTSLSAWENAQQLGYYEADSLKIEGFIHCSTKHQVQGVLDRYFNGQHDLIKLTIDPQKLSSKLVFELSPSVNQEFPHVFGVIPLEAIIQTEQIR
ncbi:MAG: DUF952 domain-containing protein [Chitinophagaceae bacterium]|nr:DUF952 domain-containing protein [Chitinophagaceae bacterium]